MFESQGEYMRQCLLVSFVLILLSVGSPYLSGCTPAEKSPDAKSASVKEDSKKKPADAWTLRGRVLDDKDIPVAGVKIFVGSQAQTMGRSYFIDSLGVITDGNGRFDNQVKHLQAWRSSKLMPITFVHSDYPWKKVDIESLRNDTRVIDIGDVRLERGLYISGTVTDEKREPVANARVVIGDDSFYYPLMRYKRDKFQRNTVTDKNGGYCFKGLTSTALQNPIYTNDNNFFIVRTWTDLHAPTATTPFTLSSKDITGKDLILTVGGKIKGKVTTKDGTPIKNCRVVIDSAAHLVIEDPKTGDRFSVFSSNTLPRVRDGYYDSFSTKEPQKVIETNYDFIRSTVTDAEGNYELVGIPLGRRFSVSTGYPREFPPPFEGKPYPFGNSSSCNAGNSCDIKLTFPAEVSFTLFDADSGKPISGYVEIERANNREEGWTPVKSDGFSIRGNFIAGKINLIVSARGYQAQKKEIEVAEGEILEGLEFKLEKSRKRIRGRVIDSVTGKPVPDVEVWAYEWAQGWQGAMSLKTRTGADGSYEVVGFSGSFPGKNITHWVKVSGGTYLEKKVHGSFGNENSVEYEIELKKGCFVEGRVIAPGSTPVGMVVSCTGFPRGKMAYKSIRIEDVSGKFRFGPIKAGKHAVWVEDVRKEIEPVSGETVNVEITVLKK